MYKNSTRSIPVVAIQASNEEMLTIYESINQTAEDGLDPGAVSRCIRGMQNTHHGLRFERATEAHYLEQERILKEMLEAIGGV